MATLIYEEFCFIRFAEPWLRGEGGKDNGAGDGVHEVEGELWNLREPLGSSSEVACEVFFLAHQR